MSETYYDIIIIGAGIAGLSAANAIASESDLTLAIIEGTCIGYNNPSPLTFSDIIEKHNLTDCIKKKYSSFAFHNYKGSFIKYIFDDYPLVVLDYKMVCQKLFDTIQRRKIPIEIVITYATNISKKGQEVSIKLKNGRKLAAGILIDSSGKSQFVATHFQKSNFSIYSHVYGAVFSGIKEEGKDLCCFLLPNNKYGLGGGWFYSLADGKASLGFANISKSPAIDYTQLKKNFNLAFKEFKPYSDYLRDSKLDYVETGSIPISYIKKFVYENILIVGDAAGMATNWTCMGTEPALEFGKLAGDISVKALKERNINILYEFQHVWEKANKETFDSFAKQAENFWVGNYDFWEWIIKNDLSFLSPRQVLDRIRNNKHMIKKHQIITRTLKNKIKSILNKDFLKPQNFVIKS